METNLWSRWFSPTNQRNDLTFEWSCLVKPSEAPTICYSDHMGFSVLIDYSYIIRRCGFVGQFEPSIYIHVANCFSLRASMCEESRHCCALRWVDEYGLMLKNIKQNVYRCPFLLPLPRITYNWGLFNEKCISSVTFHYVLNQ